MAIESIGVLGSPKERKNVVIEDDPENCQGTPAVEVAQLA